VLILSWTDKKSGETLAARFDVVTTETHESVMTITSHPVEEGANITDHARPENQRITIEGYVSNKPLWSNPGVEKFAEFRPIELAIPKQPSPLAPTPGGLTRAAVGFVEGLLKKPQNQAMVLAPTGDVPARAREMWELLYAAQQARALVTVSTALADLENCLIERLSVPRTTEDGNGASFQVDVLQVRIVKSATVEAPVSAEKRGEGLTNSGSKAAQNAKNDDKKKNELKSIIVQGVDAGDDLGLPVPGFLKK